MPRIATNIDIKAVSFTVKKDFTSNGVTMKTGDVVYNTNPNFKVAYENDSLMVYPDPNIEALVAMQPKMLKASDYLTPVTANSASSTASSAPDAGYPWPVLIIGFSVVGFVAYKNWHKGWGWKIAILTLLGLVSYSTYTKLTIPSVK